MQRLLSSLTLLASTAFAQAPFDTLPPGYLNRPGDYISGGGVSYPFSSTVFHYQEAHTSWVGRAIPPVTAIGFRRGSYKALTATAVAHTIDATITMGVGSVATFTTTFATNFSSTPTVVFTNKTVNMPDWSQLSTPPWAIGVWFVLDVPFVYTGQGDFVWDLFFQ